LQHNRHKVDKSTTLATVCFGAEADFN